MMRLLRRTLPALPLLALAALVAAGCRTSWTVENRDTPVHVWLTSPELAATGGTIRALVYVGSHKAVDGPVTFPRGVENVVLAPLRMPSGNKRVSVVVDGGRLSTATDVDVVGPTWIRATVTSRGIAIDRAGAPFTAPRESSFPVSLPGT
jgi:hypothetical protein